jgi:outer membrane biosynthesis protein TonB
MNSARKYAIAGLLTFVMAGCAEKKTSVAPPAQAQAPAKDVGQAGAMYPPPLMTGQTADDKANAPPPTVAKTDTPPPPPPPQPDAKKPAPAKKPKAAKPSNPTTAEGTGDTTPAQTQAANELAAASSEPAAASPIGELSTGGAAGQSETHKGTLDLINNTENGVNAIKRSLTSQEQETVLQIKTFVSKARAAFDNDDFDGAQTLATKAKLLLDELNKD